MVVTVVPLTPLGSPVINYYYGECATAQELSVPKVRVIAEGSFADWLGTMLASYATSESGQWSLSAENWERVMREIYTLEEMGLTAPTPTPREESSLPSVPRSALFETEKRFLAQNWGPLKTMYHRRYVAILGESVLDSDSDFSALADRVFRKFGYQRIFMPFIEEPERVYEIRSPRTVR